MKNVYIENADGAYAKMWRRWGYTVVDDISKASVVQFTGGSDVSPHLYGETMHPATTSNRQRDDKCMVLFSYAVRNKIPMAGICRGGQFLNVMNGGSMHQHCDGHAIRGTHKATIRESGLIVDVTSTHHQIMRPSKGGIILMDSLPLGTYKEGMTSDKEGVFSVTDRKDEDDVEAVYYENTNSLCYQPHPEWCEESSSCVQAYKSFLRNYLGIDV